MNNAVDPRLKLWSIILMAGCGMMFLAFFMPWWGLTVTFPAPPSRPDDNAQMEEYGKDKKDWEETMKKIGKHLKKYEKKHKAILGEDFWNEMGEDLKEKGGEQGDDVKKGELTKSVSITARVWGLNFVGIALTAFIFSIVLLPIAIVPIFVPMLRRWIWIGYFVAAVSGLVLFILSLVWYFTSPGANLPKYVWQGVGLSPGPYLEIFGTLATLASGVLGGVFGLLTFLKPAETEKPQAKRKRPSAPQFEDFDDDDFKDEM